MDDKKEWTKSNKRTLDDVLIDIQELEFLNRALRMQMIKNDIKIRELEDEMVKVSEEKKNEV